LIPFKYGEALPSINYKNNKAVIIWKDGQTDTLVFNMDTANRNHLNVERNGQTIISNK
jgi:hypothetical protein